MSKIIKMGGYVYQVEGEKGFEVYTNMGKDIDDPMWEEEAKELKEIEIIPIDKPKKKKTKKEDK